MENDLESNKLYSICELEKGETTDAVSWSLVLHRILQHGGVLNFLIDYLTCIFHRVRIEIKILESVLKYLLKKSSRVE